MPRQGPTKAEIKAAFKVADKDGNGKLTASEVKGLMEALGEDVNSDSTAEQLKMFMNMADTDGDKMVNYKEVIRIMCGDPDPKDIARTLFKMYDADGNGKLTKKEMAEFGKSMGEVDARSLNIMTTMADKDKDGTISFTEFCAIMGFE